jgi:hypothetical protein
MGSEYPSGFCLIFTEMVSRKMHLLLDRRHHVIGALIGQPQGAHDWKAVHDGALGTLQAAAADMGFTEREVMGGRHGFFPTVAHGLSYGGGQKVSMPELLFPLLTKEYWLPRNQAFSATA